MSNNVQIAISCSIEALSMTRKTRTKTRQCKGGNLNPDEPLAVIWDDDDGKRYWCIGFYIRDNEDETIQIDHLTQQQKGSCVQWIRHEVDDLQSVQPIQLLPMKIKGHWDFSSERHPSFNVDNLADIESFFKNNYLGWQRVYLVFILI